MSYQKKNIIIGAADVWLADSDATLPAFDKSEAYGDTLEGTDGVFNVGYTTDGVTVSNEPTFTDVTVDQSLDSPRVFKTQARFTVATTMSEGTLENLAVAWGQATPSAPTSPDATTGVVQSMDMEAGTLGEAPLERQFIAIGNGLENTPGLFDERVYVVQRAIQTDTSAHSMTRDAAVTFPVSLRILPGDDGAPYGTITDRRRLVSW